MVHKHFANKIYKFLDKYANIKPDYDPRYDDEEDMYTSPDASELKSCADLLSKNIISFSCSSSWESGGYSPYTSTIGKKEHDEIIRVINNLKYKIV